MNAKNKCQRVKILSENERKDIVEIEFVGSGIKMPIPKNVLQRKVENGFYNLEN